ncbi:thiaminase (transcriptional activator TenA) [Raineyella antarctica]|uniref:Aminopyrimidine aminohydrolase n=1 Tax=Raineyella antarctica TaxID=1577474 RepID=A0A1G6H7A0_9ACTN|nr:TenA family protein [Raineyella antarctica]SDB90159.1 thiaminase (transcriptional activator TenA) [Raineyella antarctica]
MSTDATTDFTRRLREDCLDCWGAVTDHPFVTDLFAGTLDDVALVHYLVQDYQFFDPFIRLLGEAVATAPTAPARLRLSRQLGMLATDENGYFERAFDTFDVELDDRLHPPLCRETVDLLDLIFEAIETHSWPHVLSVLVVLEWIYLDWAESPERTPASERAEHLEWIDLHRGHEFRDWVRFLRQQLDAAEPEDLAAAERCQDMFRRAVEAEYAFFDAAYHATGPCQETPRRQVPDDLTAHLDDAFHPPYED